ncbi:hypothetical protein CBR56_28240 [Bacillus thuringiensis]|uniref:insecticidal delta-endotoxin Cry8Ea1 family protein n=1 Tax=Bacillus tropicus TaxID=2026188 RepID=UPI0001CADE0E|nr:insecticidal delta-endotoxin Cry8Ea1 family protein [Bacillus tropicus]MED3037197.1 insecticidal delta-endotoxin Cry8Ea1 family protein [Bacillus tropicus]OTX76813.1 hypothetical protein BK728_25115 [Bacillus thuringiensis serovar chanpaisis]PNK22913.1 hypothetical protein CBR56_28240 [Bacillus thuringiensis]
MADSQFFLPAYYNVLADPPFISNTNVIESNLDAAAGPDCSDPNNALNMLCFAQDISTAWNKGKESGSYDLLEKTIGNSASWAFGGSSPSPGNYLDMAKISIGLTGHIIFLGLTTTAGLAPGWIVAGHVTKRILVPISKLLATTFWPKKNDPNSASDNTWHLVSDRVETLVQQDITAYDSSSLTQFIAGFQAVLDDLHEAVAVAICQGQSPDNQTALNCKPYADEVLNENVRVKFATAEETFRSLLPQFQKSGYEFTELPQFCQAATLHLSLLHSAINMADNWGIPPALKNNYAAQLRTLIQTYTQYVYSTFENQRQKVKASSWDNTNQTWNGVPKSGINRYLQFLQVAILECLDYVATWRFYDVYDYPLPAQSDFSRIVFGTIVGPSENVHKNPSDKYKGYDDDPVVKFVDFDLNTGANKSPLTWPDFENKTYMPIDLDPGSTSFHLTAHDLNHIYVDGIEVGYNYTDVIARTSKKVTPKYALRDTVSPNTGNFPQDQWAQIKATSLIDTSYKYYPLNFINIGSRQTDQMDYSEVSWSINDNSNDDHSTDLVFINAPFTNNNCSYPKPKDLGSGYDDGQPCQSNTHTLGTDVIRVLYPVVAQGGKSTNKIGFLPLYMHTNLEPTNIIGQLDPDAPEDSDSSSEIRMLQTRTIPVEKGVLSGAATNVVERVTGSNSVLLKNKGSVKVPITVQTGGKYFIRVHAATTAKDGKLSFHFDSPSYKPPEDFTITLENTKQYLDDTTCNPNNSCYNTVSRDCSTCDENTGKNTGSTCYHTDTKTCSAPSHPMWIQGVENRVYALFPKMGIDTNNPGNPAIPQSTIVELMPVNYNITITNTSDVDIIIDRIEFMTIPKMEQVSTPPSGNETEKQIAEIPTSQDFYAVSGSPTLIWETYDKTVLTRAELNLENPPSDILNSYQFQFYYDTFPQSATKTTTNGIDSYSVPSGFNKIIFTSTVSQTEPFKLSGKIYEPIPPIDPPGAPPTEKQIGSIPNGTPFIGGDNLTTTIWSSLDGTLANHAELTIENYPSGFLNSSQIQFLYNGLPQQVNKKINGNQGSYVVPKGFNQILLTSTNSGMVTFNLSGKVYAPLSPLDPPVQIETERQIDTIASGTPFMVGADHSTTIWNMDGAAAYRAELQLEHYPSDFLKSATITFSFNNISQPAIKTTTNGIDSYSVPQGFDRITLLSTNSQWETITLSGKIYEPIPPIKIIGTISKSHYMQNLDSIIIWSSDTVGQKATISNDATIQALYEFFLNDQKVSSYHSTPGKYMVPGVDYIDVGTDFNKISFSLNAPGNAQNVDISGTVFGPSKDSEPSSVFTKQEDLDKIKQLVNSLFHDVTHTTLSPVVTEYWIHQVRKKILALSDQKFGLQKKELRKLLVLAQRLSANRNLLSNGNFNSSTDWLLGRHVKIFSDNTLFTGNYAFLPSPVQNSSYVFQKIDESKLKPNTRYIIRGFVANSEYLEVVAARYGIEVQQMLNVPYGTALPISSDSQSNCCKHMNTPCTPNIPDNEQAHIFNFSIDVGSLHPSINLGIEFGLRIVNPTGSARVSHLEIVEERPLTAKEICTVQQREKKWKELFTKEHAKISALIQSVLQQLLPLYKDQNWNNSILDHVTYQDFFNISLPEIPKLKHWFMEDREGEYFQITTQIRQAIYRIFTQLEEKNLLHNGSFSKGLTDWIVEGEPRMISLGKHMSALQLSNFEESVSQTITINEFQEDQEYRLRIYGKGKGTIVIQNGDQVETMAFASNDFKIQMKYLYFDTSTVTIDIQSDEKKFLVASVELFEVPSSSSPSCN